MTFLFPKHFWCFDAYFLISICLEIGIFNIGGIQRHTVEFGKEQNHSELL